MSILRELQRRNVLRVAAGYIAVSWLVVQVMDTLSEAFGLTGEHIRIAVIVLAICFIPVLIVSWAFELTPEGFKRDADVERDTPAAQKSQKRLDRIVMAALALAVAYFVIDEVVIEPRQVTPATDADRSIAVLPFVNLSADPEQEFFSDGISEEMLNLLAGIRELRVISRTSAFQYKDTDKDIPTIAAELSVAHILEGSVRKAGDTVRVTVQLIHGPTDAQVWSETWDRELDNIFAIQNEIATLVVDQLRMELVGEIPRSNSVDSKAFLLFLEADYLMQFGIPGGQFLDGVREAVVLLEQALEIEPDYVDALNELSIALYRLWSLGGTRAQNDPMLLRSVELHERAFSLDPNNPTTLAYRGYGIMLRPGYTTDAAAIFERALNLDPTNEDVMRVGLQFARSIGYWDKAIELGRFQTSRDPRCADCFYQLSVAYRDAGQFEAAREVGEIARALGVNMGFSLARTSLFEGDPVPMLTVLETAEESWQSAAYRVMALHSAGRQDESDVALTHLLTSYGDTHPFEIAKAFAWRDDPDNSFEWLDRALEKYRLQVLFSNQSPEFRNLYDDPRWDEFLRRIERHPDQLAEIRFDPQLPD
jgi:adenylate cyclase